MKTEFDPKKVYLQGNISPFVYYEGLGKIALWAFDKKALLLDYTFVSIWRSTETTEIPCEKHEIISVLQRISNGEFKPKSTAP